MCIYFFSGYFSYDFTSYEFESELFVERAFSKMLIEVFDDVMNCKCKYEVFVIVIFEVSWFEEIDFVFLDNVCVVLDDLRRDVDAYARFVDVFERWFVAFAINIFGIVEDFELFVDVGELDVYLIVFNVFVVVECVVEARFRFFFDVAS